MPENLINRKGIAPNLPVAPTVPDIDSVGNPIPKKSAAETWMDALNRTNSGVIQDIPMSSVYIGERYDDTMPGTDYEETAAQQQSWGSKAANSLGKMGVLATTTFLQNTIGAVNGLVEWNKTGNPSSFYNNDFNKWVGDLNERLEDRWANYYTAAERDADWYSPKKLFSANFFWDGIIKNLGFSLGTIASGALFAGGIGALSRTLALIPKAGKLFSMGKAAETLAATEEALRTATVAGRAASTYGKMTELSNKFLGQYKLLNPGNKTVVAGLATSGESAFEAYHNMNEHRDRRIQEYKDANYGMSPTGEELQKINEEAEKVGNWSYLMNSALLTFTNYIQFPKIFGSSYRAEKGIANAVTHKIKDITKEGSKYVVAPARGGRVLSTLNKIRPYTFSASEAFEEGSQFAITKGTQDYFDKKYNNIPNTFLQSVMEGVYETIGTNEGMENVLIGGLSGALMLGAGKFREARALSAATDAALSEGGRWTSSAGINTAGFSEFTKDTYDSIRRASYLQQQREGAIADGNILDSKDLEADYVINYLTPRIKFGRFDLVMDDINDYKQLASTEEGFAQLVKEGKALETDTREAFMARLNLMEQTANDVKNFYQSLTLRYAGVVDDKGDRVYSPEVIDKMIYAASKIADYDRRIPSLSAQLATHGINSSQVITDIVAGKIESFNEATAKIETLNLTDDQKLDIGQALDDVAEMSLRRNKFLQEYSDIKNNPSEYKEQRAEDIQTSENEEKPTILIKTKDGEREFETGVDYYLGDLVKEDKKTGKKTRRFPKITIIGENEDGTIKIKDSTGRVVDISKSELEEYKLFKASKVDDSENSRFFVRNIVNVPDNEVYWNIGKKNNKDGFYPDNKIPGTLRYNSKTDSLEFVYKNRRGETRYKEIGIDQFKPKGDFKEGVFSTKYRPDEVADNKDIESRNSSGRTKEDINRRRGQRLDVLEQLFDENAKKQQVIENLLDKKKNELNNIKNQLDKLREQISKSGKEVDKRYKRVKFKSSVRTAMDTALRLSRMQEQLENEIKDLEVQRDDIGMVLETVTNMAEDIDSYPTSFKDFIEELNNDIIDLEVLQEETWKQIGSLSKLINEVKNVLDKALGVVENLVRDYIERFPNAVALWGDDLSFIPTKAIPVKPEHLQILEDFVASVEDNEITPNSEKLDVLNRQMDELQEVLKQTDDQIRTKRQILEKFEKVAKEYQQQKEQETVLKNKQLIKDALGTADSGNVQTKNREGKIYEPSFKKAIEFIWRSTIAPTRGMKPHHVRANKFGFNLEKFENRENIRGVFITSDNENLLIPGLTDHLRTDEIGNIDESIRKDSIIALVMIDESGNLVGENGQPLTEEQLANPLEYAIYQTMPEADLRWKMTGLVGESMFREQDESRAESVRSQYAEYRNRIFELSKEQSDIDELVDQAHLIGASFGHPRYAEKLGENGQVVEDEKGKPLLDYDTRTAVSDAGLVTSDELETNNVLLIPTTNDIVDIGTTRYEGDNLGRPFIRTKNGAVPLQNRHHTRKEAETIFDVLVQVAKNMIDPEVGVKHSKTVRLFEWLETVVYWGIPTRPDGTRKSEGYNSVFWEVNEDGDFVLSLSGKGTTFKFNPRSLTENRETIIGMLEGMYNNVKTSRVKEISESYEEILSIDENGEPVVRVWKNYQNYLLSDKIVTFDESDKDNGKQRSDIPLTTIMTPLENENDINRTGIYFFTEDNLNEVDIPEVRRPTSIKAGTPKVPKQEPFVFDGKTRNTITTPNGEKITFTVDENNNFKVIPDEGLVAILDRWAKAGQIADPNTKEGVQQGKERINKIVQTSIELQKQAPKKPEPPKTTDPISDDDFNKFVDKGEVNDDILKSIANKIKDGKNLSIREQSIFTGKTGEINEILKKQGDSIVRRKISWSKGHSSGLYRVIPGNQPDKFKKENWTEVERWLKANFPNIPVYRVKNVIQATNGRQAWGMFKDGALYIYENAEVGTVYHEVFEAVWKMFTDTKEQDSIRSEFRQRKGTFVDRPSGETINYADATDQQVKEQLAEEFRDYVHYKKIPPKPAKGRPFILKLFSDIVNFIKRFFLGKDSTSKVEEMFKKISTGGYRNLPHTNQLSLANRGIIDIDEAYGDEDAELREALTGSQRHQVIENMLYYTLFDLIKNDENIFNLSDRGIKKANLYNNLKEWIINDLINQTSIDIEGLTEDQAEINIRRAEDMVEAIESGWGSIISRYEEYLKKYDIEFDENDIIAINEYEKSKEDPYGEANKIDHFKKSNSAVKLLLATMIEVDKDGTPIRNSMGGVNLIPTSRTTAVLYNKLHNSRTVEEMIYKLGKLSEADPNYRGLYRRLTKKEYNQAVKKVGNQYIADFSGIKSQHGSRLLSSFYNLFSKQNPQVLTVTVFENGEVAVGDTHLSTYAVQMREDYINGIVAKAREGSNFFTYDKERRLFKGNPEAVRRLKLNNTQSRVKFLNDIGIDFKLSDANELSRYKLLNKFNETVDGIRKSIEEQNELVSISRQVLSINKRLMDLAYLESAVKNPGFDTTFFNINRERTQSFIGKNPPSDLYHFLSQIDKFDEVNLEGTGYEYLLKDIFSKGSSILKRMFNKGNRVESEESDNLLKVVYISGTDNIDKGKTKQSSKLNYKERLIQELNVNLDGYYLNLVPGDASMEWAMYMGNPVSERDIRGNKSVMWSIFKDYFIDELELARDSNRNVDNSRRVKGKNPREMRFFKDILGSELHKEIISISDNITSEEVYNSKETKIKRAIEKYIKEANKNYKQLLERYNIITLAEDGNYEFDNVAIEGTLSESGLETKLSFINVNYMIANIEFHKLLYGDPYQYSDELKRIKNFNSPRQNIINNSPEMNRVFNEVWNKDFQEGDPGWTNFSQEYFKTATHEDVLSTIQQLQGYENPYKETDGGGMMSFKAYRNFRIRGQDWNDNEERQYLHDMQYEKMIKEGATQEELDEFNKSNPRVRSAYTPIKPIVSGSKKTKGGNNEIVLDKFALYPVSLRLLSDINKFGDKKTSNSIALYNKMQNENIDYITFKSSRKVGTIDSFKNYNSDGTINLTPYSENYIVNIPLSIIATQSEVPSKDTSPKRGTQITKLATMDYMDAGVPIDFIVNDSRGREVKDVTKRYRAWHSLSKDQKEEQSPLYKEIMYNQRLLEAKINIGYRKLLTSLGLKEQYNRGKNKYEYVITDSSQAVQTIREEMLKREVSDNISDALKAFENNESIIEATPAYHQIRNILYSIADREVISQRINGGMKVQLPSSFLEETKTKAVEVNGKQTYVSDTLEFYEEDGVAEIMISRWFDSPMSDRELLDYLNNTEEGKKVLSGIGFRIPTQKQNSIERFRIKQFLPQEFGDAVIVPSAIVNKAGSDFDIDKLTIYLKNVLHGKLVTLKTDENSTARERYSDWVLSVTNKDVKKYARFLSRDIVSSIREKYDKELQRLRDEYSELVETVSGVAYDELIRSYNEIENDTSQDDYITELFEIGKAIFRKLPNYIKEEFFMMRDYISDNNIEGPAEVAHYLSMAQDMIESGEFDVSEKILKDLISIYEQELEALGSSTENIKKAKETALVTFRESKSGAIEGVRSLINTERSFVLSSQRSELSDFYQNEYIDEIVRIRDLSSFEEFQKLNILEQNRKEALENEYIQSLENLVSHPLNRERLLKPNSAKQLEDLSKEIVEKTEGSTFDYTNVINMLDRRFMSMLRHAFVIGKYAIGIAAVNQTNHSINQRQLIYIDPDRKANTFEEDRDWLGDMKINFEAYNKFFIEGKGEVATLSMIQNADGQDISEIISQFIDGYVDISKGPWIIELGATPNVVSTWLFLIKAGVPVDTVAYFMNQPIVRDHLRTIENAGYSWLFIPDFVQELKDNYNTKGSYNITKIPSKKNLKSTLGKTIENLSDREKAEQQFILDEFLKYAKMASHMFYVTQGTNFDTANFNDPFLVFKKYKQLEKAQQSVISDVNDILENSFLGTLGNTLQSMRDSLSQFLISDKPKVRNIIEKILTPYVDMSDNDFVKIARKVVSDLFDYVVQVDQELNSQIKDILINDGGVALELKNFMDDIKNTPNHSLYNNYIVGEKGILTTELSRRASNEGSNNIKIRGLQNNVYDQNNIIYAFREIREHLKDRNKLYDNIVTLAILQSGLSTSSISFTSVLPYEDFARIYQTTLSKIEAIPNLERFYELNVLQRNNWDNDNIVPRIKARWTKTKKYNPSMEFLPRHVKNAVSNKVIPNVVQLWDRLSEVNSDHVVYTWEQYEELADKAKKLYPKLSKNDAIKKLKADMRKVGDFSYINRGLFQKVRDPKTKEPLTTSYKNENGDDVIQHVYKMINAWGEGRRANEFYDTAKESVIDNGFIKVEEVSDNTVIGIFKGEKVNKKATEKDSAVDSTVNSKIKFSEDQSYGYRERTIKNASADATIAIAVDFNSAGEKLTKNSVLSQKKKYIPISATSLNVTQELVNRVVRELNSVNAKSLNIAGNGIYTMRGRYTQQQVDEFTYQLLRAVTESPNLKNKITSIRTGGQTGFDEAGAKAGVRLGISTSVLAPKGWKFRNKSGQDISSEKSFKDRFAVIGGVDMRNAPPGFPETKRPDKKC